ncbi:MAG: RdgB/HAM1 family non-canonical purine NTP pyrophosphatase [Gammaproteobacteria bacterium]|nr:RdgB/HAM1 family non-canonical purine NTP pyrophosphatase [Gammaproteobacteria bacterium]
MHSHRSVVLASRNPGKLKEFREMMAGLDVDIVPLPELAIPEVEESEDSFAANAVLKARHAAQHAGLPAIADDSGLEVDVLGGEPGVRSARYAGQCASDEDNLRLLLYRIACTGAVRPAARFQCAMAFVSDADDPAPVIARGTWEGFVVMEPRGRNGFGYDPVFFVPTHGCTSAELPPEVKNRISHRARALMELRRELSAMLRPRSAATA